IGRYQLLAELGRGGMATVYRAYDPHFKREVALKVLPREFNHDPMFRARFQREAETIAALEHPAIVPVYDFGEDDGLPFLVMRLMAGDSLADRIAEGPLPVSEVARILARVGSALDRAHEAGVVHRDLKPGNILFDQYGEAYLADFGIARLVESSATLTGSGIVGTPAYMSPEQIQGQEVDGRSDIYALGIILFEMLTGKRPYDADTPAMVLVKQMTEPTPRILDVKPDLPPTCEFVIARAMAKDVTERYARASEVAQTLTGIVQETVSARAQSLQGPPPAKTAVAAPQPTAKQPPAAKHLEKGRLPAWAWGVIGLLLAVIVLGGAWVIWGRDGGGTAVPPTQTPDVLTPGAPPSTVTVFVDDLAALQRLGRGTVNVIAASPDGQTLAVGGSLGVWLYDGSTFEPQALLTGHTDIVWDVAWSPDGTQLASASWDQTIRVWDVASAETLFTLRGDDQYTNVAWSSNGMLAATTWYPAVELWDVARRQRTAVIELPDETIRDLAWSLDGAQLAATGEPGIIHIWDAASQAEVMQLAGHEESANCVSWSPDGALLASCGGEEDSTVRLWNTSTGEELYALEGHEYGVYGAAWIPDSDFLVTVGGNGAALMWNVVEGWEEHLLAESTSTLFDVAWLDEVQRLVLSAEDGSLLVLSRDGADETILREHTNSLWDLSWSPNGVFLAAAGADSTVRVWRAASGEAIGAWPAHEYGVTAVAWSP
ncbi:MAG: serine/threonine protein kinase, partial [Anaerolineales bacterium]|nr:serine/threonine protein kinase [Anaerolineales bacterium]